MKKAQLTLIVIFLTLCITVMAQPNRHKDTARLAKNAVKEWFIAFDGGNFDKLKKLSVDSTSECHLQFILMLHLTEKDMFLWSEAKWWSVQKKNINGIEGYLVTPTLDSNQTTVKNSFPSLPVFVYMNKKQHWVVDIYRSEFSLIESDCPE
jgi:hypothetical protein